MTNAIRAVFLDAGGTIIHLDAPYILEVLAQQGLERDAAAFARAERAARTAIAQLVSSGQPTDDRSRWRIFAHTLLAELGCDDIVASAVRTAVAAHNQAGRLWSRTVEGTAEVLAALRAAGYHVAVVSNSNGHVERFLENAGLRPYLDFVIDSGIEGVEKPDPRIFEIALARAGVAAHEAVHVGDIYEIDVVGARAAGLRPVLLDPDDLAPGADCTRIRSLAELPAWLAQGAPA